MRGGEVKGEVDKEGRRCILLSNSLEALLEVRLDSSGVLGLREDLQHLIVGEEEEAGKEQTLLLKVSVQALQDLVQKIVAASEFVKEARL